MNPARGRPSKVNQTIIVDIILEHGDEILLQNKKVVGKSKPIWDVISRELDNNITSRSLYVFVTYNRYGVRDKLLQRYSKDSKIDVSASDGVHSGIVFDSSSICKASSEEQDPQCLSFTILVLRFNFEDLVTDRLYKRTDKKNRGYRQQKVLKPGKWQEMITHRIWDANRIKCGFNFQNHFLSGDAKSGSINEDWRGHGKASEMKSRKARYLGMRADEVRDKLLFEKHITLPIMKNGNSGTLQSVKIRNENICLYNTCAFDSLLQIMLSAICDWPLLREAMAESKEGNPFIKMCFDIFEKGLRAYSYKSRAAILLDLLKKDSDIIRGGCRLIDCTTNVGYFAGVLFRSIPSYRERSQCDNGCPTREKTLPVITIQRATLCNGQEFKNVILDQVRLTGQKRCSLRSCSGWKTTEILALGELVLFEVFDFENDDWPIKLGQIPKRFVNPVSSRLEIYELVGLVHYKGPGIRTRTSDDGEKSRLLGHYTAISRRRGESWVEYDDTHERISD